MKLKDLQKKVDVLQELIRDTGFEDWELNDDPAVTCLFSLHLDGGEAGLEVDVDGRWRCDLLVGASNWEGFGLTALEAWVATYHKLSKPWQAWLDAQKSPPQGQFVQAENPKGPGRFVQAEVNNLAVLKSRLGVGKKHNTSCTCQECQEAEDEELNK
jgi:hypothetical protein